MSPHSHGTPEDTTATGKSMKIPPEWLAEAGVENFVPDSSSFRCTGAQDLIPLTKIERVIRTVSLDANGLCRDRMMRILVGIRNGDDLPPVPVERTDAGHYRLREGTHRFYASLTLGFSHLPVEICERY